jgi:excisionase family DNA binding protein
MIDGSTPIWQLTVDQLKELIQSMAIVPTEKPEVIEDSYLTSKEAQAYLKVSVTTLYRWRRDKYIRIEKKGGIVRVKKSECDRVLNQTT